MHKYKDENYTLLKMAEDIFDCIGTGFVWITIIATIVIYFSGQ